MRCKWYAEFEGVCTNGACPYSGDTCPTSEHPEVCKYAEYAEKQPEKPYYGITYFDLTDGEMHSGFGSYSLDFVFKWFAEEFDVAKPELPKEEER